MKIRRALFSVTEKKGCRAFAEQLASAGVEIVSTGGTAKAIREQGIPVIDVADVTGYPEMLDGRVKTLHPNIAGGVLALRDNPSYMATLELHKIPIIDMVVVNLYQFANFAASSTGLLNTLEAIDVGGVTLLRAAIKTYPHVAVVTDPADYPEVAANVRESGAVPDVLAWRLAQKASQVLHEDAKAIRDYLRFLDHCGRTG